jgi:methylated-DNA-protein-cysteine methyltransferase-like protein
MPTKKADSGEVRLRIEKVIRAIPLGKVLTYGGVAKAAGFPGLSRMVARILHRGFGLPWQRVLGAGGEIKLRGESAMEQRFRLQAEGVRFRGRRVDIKECEWKPALRRLGRTRANPKAKNKNQGSGPRG